MLPPASRRDGSKWRLACAFTGICSKWRARLATLDQANSIHRFHLSWRVLQGFQRLGHHPGRFLLTHQVLQHLMVGAYLLHALRNELMFGCAIG
jgi:hypothetical protein